ncbi:MAG: hypothetical protein GY799_00890, partial [Desulfobulbaceae bacterium]|nr:hypothetical protein [Desulfobulbaceae bacterium]
TITTGTGTDTIIGDNGSVDFTSGLTAESTDLDDSTGARDDIVAGGGNNNVIGGTGDDDITTGTGNDYILGDHGIIVIGTDGLITSMDSTLDNLGDADTIAADEGDNVVIAGQGGDTVTTGSDNDVVLGDSGNAQFTSGVLDTADSATLDQGGDDVITILGGDNTVIGGTGTDTITTGTGTDTIIGDNGSVDSTSGLTAESTDL